MENIREFPALPWNWMITMRKLIKTGISSQLISTQ